MNTHFYTCMLYILIVKEQKQSFLFRENETNNSLELQVENGKSQAGIQLLCLCHDQNMVCVYSTDTSHAPILGQTLVRC